VLRSLSKHIISAILLLTSVVSFADGLELGIAAPEIKMSNQEGKIIKLSDLKGKVVLIDFWASWCGWCRIDNPALVSAYEKYKDKGFEIFSVSLDFEKDKWLKAIKDDSLIWDNHVCDFQVWNSMPILDYEVYATPFNYLINENGLIVAKDVPPLELEDKLEWFYYKQVYCYPKKVSDSLYFSSKVKFSVVAEKGSKKLKGKGESLVVSSLKAGEYKVVYDTKVEIIEVVKSEALEPKMAMKLVAGKLYFNKKYDYTIYSLGGKEIGKGCSDVVDIEIYKSVLGHTFFVELNGKLFSMSN